MEMPEISVASKVDDNQAIDTLTMGFSADPLARWFFPTAELYLRTAGPMFTAFGGLDIDTTTVFAADNFEGVAVWHPPGTHASDDAVGQQVESTMPADILEDVVAVFEQIESYHPEGDIWYLPLIAVDPAHQGKGIGASLMKAALQKCDEALQDD